jgi:hypothetical protein
VSETRFREKFGAVELVWAQNQLGTLETEKANAVRLGEVLGDVLDKAGVTTADKDVRLMNLVDLIERACGGPDALVVKPKADDA